MENVDNLRLLIVEKSEKDAESLANILREGGHHLRFGYARDAQIFETALLEQVPDIVLCGKGEGVISTETVQGILAQHKLSPPLIAVAGEAPEAAVVAAGKSGISALVSSNQPGHLELAFSQVLTLLKLQQRVADLEAALDNCENRCNSLSERSTDAVACMDEGMLCFVNQSWMDLFGIENRKEIEAMPVVDMICAEQRDTFNEFLRKFQAGSSSDSMLRIKCVNHDHTAFDRTLEFAPASIDGKPCTQIVIRTGKADLDENMESMAHLDTLTGLYNRQHFMNLLGEEVTQAEKDGEEARALIYITLDGFKEVREENGIAASDTVLCEIARLLEKQCNTQDSIARFGDYSFTILHHASSSENVQAKAEKLLRHISAHISETDGRSITLSCSIGICAVTEHTTDAQKILSHADTACEVARSSGGNRIHTHSAVIDEQVSQGHEEEWDKVIRNTIDEQRFYLAYQPIISLAGDTSKCYEALLRIVDEEGHTILPGQFIELAEKSGLSREIDYWVFEAAFRTIVELRENGDDITVYLKLSRSVLADTKLPAWINDKLKEYRLSHSSVVFEVKELDAANDLKSAITFVKAMKKLQCRVALEHFGLSKQPLLLKHVPADILKIDGSLTENLASNKEQQSRVRALVKLAHNLGTVCIAERIDNPGDLAVLWQNGVDMIQGNFIQAPSRVLDYDFEGELA